MKVNKLYLFYPASLLGWLISVVTRSPFCHAAIEVDGVLWDASESRGYFGRSGIDVSKRKHVCLEFAGDLSSWLDFLQGREYDWIGVLGWLFHANSRRRFYCFEAAWLALSQCGIAKGSMPTQLSGSDLAAIISDHAMGKQSVKAAAGALQILRAISYEHTARASEWLASRDGQALGLRIINHALILTNTSSVDDALAVLAADRDKLIKVEERIYQLLHAVRAEDRLAAA